MSLPDSFGRSVRPDVKKSAKPLNMDSALALLRRELVAMQLQDKALHKQLLQLQSSIVGLKTDLSIEREQGWHWENGDIDSEVTRVSRETHARTSELSRENPAIVTKVEVLVDHSKPKLTKLQANHVKQDSGILTDDEDNSDEADETFRKSTECAPNVTKNFVRMQSGKSNSFHARGREGGRANFQRSWSSRSLQPSKVLVRSVEVPKSKRKNAEVPITKRENAEVTSNLYSPRPRSQTMPSTPFYRVASMPVINELPTQERPGRPQNEDRKFSDKDRSFGVYESQRDEGRTKALKDQESNEKPSANHHRPAEFYSLQRHDSMPTLFSHAGNRTFRTMSDSEKAFRKPESIQKTESQNLTRRVSTSYVDLRRTSALVDENTDDFTRHKTESHGISQRISTSYVDLRRTSRSPENEVSNDFAKTFTQVSTRYVDLKARSPPREPARDKSSNDVDYNRLVRRISTSYVDLRSPAPAIEETNRAIIDINCNEAKPISRHKLYRSHSQTSLV